MIYRNGLLWKSSGGNRRNINTSLRSCKYSEKKVNNFNHLDHSDAK